MMVPIHALQWYRIADTVTNRFISKSLYFVVYDANGLQMIKNNMKEYGISFDEIQFSQNEINIVYTSKGTEDNAFKNMLGVV